MAESFVVTLEGKDFKVTVDRDDEGGKIKVEPQEKEGIKLEDKVKSEDDNSMIVTLDFVYMSGA